MDRRSFLRAAGSAATLTLTSSLGRAAPADVNSLLGLLENTPRAQIIDRVVARIRAGLSYEDLLAALTLATVRNVQPYPDVGFKYHAVMVLQSIHLTTLGMPPAERWLPALWAVEYFKDTQAEELRASGWTMPALIPSTAPSPAQARSELTSALDRWDLEAADAAVAKYASVASPHDVFTLLFQYAARDFRSIGHKAIAAANAHRILTLLGWRHHEPVLRSLVAAMLNHDGEPNPSTAELEADAPGRQNANLLGEIPATWLEGKLDLAASRDMLAVLREADALAASRAVVGLLQDGIAPMSIWHALHAAGAELMVTDPRNVALHALTSTNALNYAFRESDDPETQQLMLLQCAAFIPMFRARIRGQDRLASLDALDPVAIGTSNTEALEDIFSDERRSKSTTMGKTLSYLEAGGAVQPLIDRVRYYMVDTATNSHDYKFAEAVFENHSWTPRSPWRDRYLGAGFVYFKGPRARSNSVIREARALLNA